MTHAYRILAAAALLALADPIARAADLTLQLADGSRVHADEVVRADDTMLTVAASRAGARIERTVAWKSVAGGTIDGVAHDVAALRQTVGLVSGGAEFTSHVVPPPLPFAPVPTPCGCGVVIPCVAPGPYLFRPVGRVIGVRPDPITAYRDLAAAVYPAGIPNTEAPFALGVLRERRRLEAINPFLVPALPPTPIVPGPPLPPEAAAPGDLSHIGARVVPIRANGGADVSALGVELVGFDTAGVAVPVEGTAQIFLYAGEQKLVRAFDDVYAARPEGLIRLAEWTRSVLPDASVVLRLPEPLPEHDPNVSPYGTLRVRLSVPGSGVFETLAEPVVLRPASPFRDAVRSETGSRFLPDEKTTGRRLETWPRKRDFSSVE